MRRGSAAIVPLFLAITLLFWFIWFLGGENDNLHKVNQLENLQHTQERLLQSAVKRYYDLNQTNPSLSKDDLKNQVDDYIHQIMQTNKIDH